MLKALLASFALCLSVASARAEDWPNKPITVLMGFPAGSGVDVVARMLQPSLEKSLGQRLVIDYKTGAGGNVASEIVANARPDGYTFLLGTAATHGVNAALYPKLAFDVEADFTPISTLVDVSNVLTINPEVIDAKSVQDFIAKVKATPGKYNYASTGNGTGTHLAFAEFNAKAGLDMVHVPYKGGPDAIQARAEGRRVLHLQPGADHPAALARRQGAAARRHDEDARGGDSRRADHRRSGRAGLRELHLVRHLRAQGPRPDDRRQVQCGDQGGARRSRDRRRSLPSSATRRATRRSSSSRRR